MEKYLGHYGTVNVAQLQQLRKYSSMVWKRSPKGKRLCKLFMLASVKAIKLN